MIDLTKLKNGDRRSLSKTISLVEKGEITSDVIKENFPEISGEPLDNDQSEISMNEMEIGMEIN